MEDINTSGRYFSEDELNAIVDGSVTPRMEADFGTPEKKQEEDRPIFDTADTLKAIPRGVVGFGKSVYNLADYVSGDMMPDWTTNPLGESKSMVGGFVEGLSELIPGFLVGEGIFAAASKVPGAIGATAQFLGASGFRGMMAKGAIADFISFEGNAGRLSDLMTKSDNPLLNNTVTQYLSTDMDDGELEGRLKNALEGGIVGAALEGVIRGVTGSAKAIKQYRALKAAGASEEEALSQAAKYAGKDLKEAQELLDKAKFEEPAAAEVAARGTDEPQATAALEQAFDIDGGGSVNPLKNRVMFDPETGLPASKSKSDVSYPIKRGMDAMVDRINREGSSGSIDRTEASFMVGLINRLGSGNFESMGIRFRKLEEGTAGSFDFLRDVLTVSTRASDPQRTFVHEIWHSLTGRIDDSMLKSMNRDFLKARAAFEKEHGLVAGAIDEMPFHKLKKLAESKNLEKDAWYRLKDLDEWVAETMTDATYKRLDLEENSKTVFGFLRYFTSNFIAEFKAKFGGKKYDKLAKDWLDGRYGKSKELYSGLERPASERFVGKFGPDNPKTISYSINGGRNFGVDEARTVASPGATAAAFREIRDLINTGAGQAAIDVKIEQLRAAGIINLRPVVQSGQRSAYAEALIAIKQAEANSTVIGPSARLTNDQARKMASAQLQAALETGGLNVAEINKILQDGVASAQQVVANLPFLFGIEAHMRNEVIRGLRTGRADIVPLVQAFTTAAGAVRSVKSNLGRGLQMIQGFGTVEDITKAFKAMAPEDRKILCEQYADVLDMLVVDPETGKSMAKAVMDGLSTKWGQIGAEAFRNSLLSGPKTLSKNVASAVMTLALPLERGAGRLFAGQRGQAAKEVGTICRYIYELQDAFQNFKTSLISEEGNSVVLGRGNTDVGEFRPGRAISSRTFSSLNMVDNATGGVTRNVAGMAVDWIGQTFNLPMRAMGSSDEFFQTLIARSESDVVFRRIVSEKMKLPMTSVAVSNEVDRLKKLLFVDGQLQNRKTTVERAFRIAKNKYLPGAVRETLTDSVAAKMGLGAADPAVQAEVSRLLPQAISGGKIRPLSEIKASKDATVLLQSIDAAGNRAKANPMFLPTVQRYVDQNWDAFVDAEFKNAGIGKNVQGLGGEDMKIIQQASAEIERRVREASWKRDYADMAESSVFGTRVVGSIGQATASAINHVPALQLVVPFVRTPTNLLAFVTDRNPLGRAYAWAQAARAGDKAAMSEAAGRLCTGTLMYSIGVVAAANGMITGKGPKDPALRKDLMAAGWQPYSFRFGDTYVSYGQTDPTATFLGLVADLHEISSQTYNPTPNDGDELTNLATAVIGSVANNVTNKSYLTGLVTTLGALTGDESKWEKLKRQYAGAVVPNLFAQVENSSIDTDVKEVRSMMDAIRARTPFVGDSVDKVRDPTGEPIKGNETWWSMFLPTVVSKRTTDPVREELANSLIGVGAPRSSLPGGIDLRSIKLESGQSAYDRLQELSGQVRLGGKSLKDQLASLIRSPFYQQLPAMGREDFNSPRVSLVRGYVSNYRRAAMEKLMRESPELAQAVGHSREIKSQMFR